MTQKIQGNREQNTRKYPKNYLAWRRFPTGHLKESDIFLVLFNPRLVLDNLTKYPHLIEFARWRIANSSYSYEDWRF